MAADPPRALTRSESPNPEGGRMADGRDDFDLVKWVLLQDMEKLRVEAAKLGGAAERKVLHL